MTIDELQVIITANKEQLMSEINKTNSAITGLKKNAEKQSNGITGVFKKLKTAIVALGIGKVIKDSIQLGMDAIESDSLFETSLGKYADDVRSWSEEVGSALGLNATTMRKNTGVIFNMTSSMGLAEKQALTMSKGVTLLANDMASFYNLDTDEAFNKIRAGITGETEPLKALGILVDENTVKQVAYSSGITTVGSELTQQQKVLARYVAILKQTGNAQGDLARTIDSPSNMFRRLSAEIQNCTTTLGSLFMPIIQTVVPYIISFVKLIGNALNSLASFLGLKSNNGLAEETENASNNIGGLSSDMANANKSAKAMKQTLAGFDEITNLNTSDKSTGNNGNSGVAVGSIDFDLSEYDAGIDSLTDKTAEITQKMESAFGNIKKIISDVWNSQPVQAWANNIMTQFNFIKDLALSLGTSLVENIVGTWNNISDNLYISFTNISTLWTNVWNDLSSTIQTYSEPIISGVTNLFNNIYGTAIGPTVELIVKVWKDFTQILLDWWNEHGQKILDKIGEFVVKTIELFQSIYDNVLAPIIEPFLNVLSELWDNHIKGLIEQLGEFIDKVIEGALDIYNKFIVPVIDWLLNTLQPMWSQIWETISSVFGTIVGTICDVASGILKALGGIIDFIVGVFTGDWEKAWNGIKNFFGGIWDGIVAIVKGAINFVIDLINGMIGALETALNWIVDKINSLEIVNPFTGDEIWSPNIPRFEFGRIPHLAKGGIVDSPTLSLIGEAGKEAVLPLESNIDWMDKLASKIAMMYGEINENSDVNNTFTSNLIINGRELARVTIDDFNNEAIRRGFKPILST